MKIIVVGISHKTAPLGIREQLSFSDIDLGNSFSMLANFSCLKEYFILSTCNRVELYAVGEDEKEVIDAIKDFLYGSHEMKKGSLEGHLYSYIDEAAIKHLHKVSAGLDSFIIGENQILGQLKRSYEQANEFKAIGPFLHKIIQESIRIGKLVRTETEISKGVTSLSGAAIELIKNESGLNEKTVLVVGAGKIGSMTVTKLCQSEVKNIILINRDISKAECFKDNEKVRISSFDHLEREVSAADIVITATASMSQIIPGSMIKDTHIKKNRNVLLIDLGVPRNIDEVVNRFENVRLFNVDDLGETIEKTMQQRESEAQKAEMIIENCLCAK